MQTLAVTPNHRQPKRQRCRPCTANCSTSLQRLAAAPPAGKVLHYHCSLAPIVGKVLHCSFSLLFRAHICNVPKSLAVGTPCSPSFGTPCLPSLGTPCSPTHGTRRRPDRYPPYHPVLGSRSTSTDRVRTEYLRLGEHGVPRRKRALSGRARSTLD